MKTIMKLSLLVALLCVVVCVSGGAFKNQFNHAMRSASAKLYRAIANESGNAVISPFSITQALGMTLAGAENNTKDQILRWLSLDRINVEGDMINKINWQMKNALSKFANTNEDPSTSVANAMWVQNDYDVNQRYRNTLVNKYQTEAFSLDFANSQAAADRINNWISEKTNDKIEDLVKPDMLDGLTRMVLTNAMYFDAKWDETFDDHDYNDDFHLRNGIRVRVAYMRKTAFMYTKTDSNFHFVAIPYKNPSRDHPVSYMVIAVPRSYRYSLRENFIADRLLEHINLGTKRGWKYYSVSLFMPKFEISHESNIKQILRSQGIRDLFLPEICDLTGISNSGELYVSDYVHKGYIKVNKEGTEAAAASAVMLTLRMGEFGRQFFVNRPFFFGIYNSNIDSFLFVGKVENPNE